MGSLLVAQIAASSGPVTGAQLALVCKSFREWVIPELYRDITLLTQEASQKFRDTLIRNKDLAKWSRSIWIGSICPHQSVRWERIWLESILVDILSRVSQLKRLALIDLPSWSTAAWSNIEPILPPGLECLAAGPEHAILVDPTLYPSLRWFCSIDTILTEAEFDVLLAMPKLRDFHWCFVDESIDLASARSLSNFLCTRTWNSVCIYIINGDEIRSDRPEELELELELEALYKDKRVKRYQLFNVDDWCSAFFRHWTQDWI